MDTERGKCKNACMKIFRPWDVSAANEQDSTISTTSQDDTDQETSSCTSPARVRNAESPNEIFAANKIKSYEYKPTEDGHQQSKDSQASTKRTTNSTKSEKERAKTKTTKAKPPRTAAWSEIAHPFDTEQEQSKQNGRTFIPCDPYTVYPDMVHSNLVQSLGLNPADSLFLESMAHGYAIEEYARIISQEQHAKILHGRKQRPKKYKCPHCDVGFSNNGQLKGHIRIHTGERPFHCDEENCGKTFTRNEELTRHKRIHSGLRPFPCSQCGKRFGRKDHLKKHTRTHVQHREVYAVPVMLPLEAWAPNPSAYPYMPLYGF